MAKSNLRCIVSGTGNNVLWQDLQTYHGYLRRIAANLKNFSLPAKVRIEYINPDRPYAEYSAVWEREILGYEKEEGRKVSGWLNCRHFVQGCEQIGPYKI